MSNPDNQRLSYVLPLGNNMPAYKFNDLGQTAIFRYAYPIAWIIQCYYVGANPLFANTGQVKTWFRASGSNASEKWFYTAFNYNGSSTNFQNAVNQARTSFLGTTYKVYGKEIYTYVEMVSDSESAIVAVDAIPQVMEDAGAMLEPNEQDYQLQAATLFSLPMWGTHFCVLGQIVDGIELYKKDGVTLITTYNQMSDGQYIKIPFDCVFIKNAAAIRINIKFYGVQ